MKIENLEEIVKNLEGELIVENGALRVYAPRGYVWYDSGCRLMVEQVRNYNYNQACVELFIRMKEGLEKCSEEQSEQILWDTGEVWEAHEDCPSEIYIGKEQ
jgi:hypothetical protein